MALADDLERIAAAVSGLAPEAALTGVLAAEPAAGARGYLCAFEAPDGSRSWLAVDDAGRPLTARRELRDVVTVAALCELAEEAAFPGDIDELRAELVALRIAESPDGIEEAEAAAAALQRVLAAPPQLATPARLDELGAAARSLEQALDPAAPSPFSAAMASAHGAVEALWQDVERGYRTGLV